MNCAHVDVVRRALAFSFCRSSFDALNCCLREWRGVGSVKGGVRFNSNQLQLRGGRKGSSVHHTECRCDCC